MKNFPEILKQPWGATRQKNAMQQGTYWGSTNIKRQCTKRTRHDGLATGICALLALYIDTVVK